MVLGTVTATASLTDSRSFLSVRSHFVLGGWLCSVSAHIKQPGSSGLHAELGKHPWEGSRKLPLSILSAAALCCAVTMSGLSSYIMDGDPQDLIMQSSWEQESHSKYCQVNKGPELQGINQSTSDTAQPTGPARRAFFTWLRQTSSAETAKSSHQVLPRLPGFSPFWLRS